MATRRGRLALRRDLAALVQPLAQRLCPTPALIRVLGHLQLGQQLLGHQRVIAQLLTGAQCPLPLVVLLARQRTGHL
ncbi:MAG: hypothetical protein V9H69_16725 [Anaerolineae bacterium]